MDMDTDALRWFQLVADGYTVTEVSEVFGVSQPGVSRALARLEQEVGTPLLRRSGRVLRMTHAGTAFKRHVDNLVNALDDGMAAVDELVDPEGGVVTLAFPLSLGSWLVPGLIRVFRRDHPRVRMVLQRTAVGESGRVSQQLATGWPTSSSPRTGSPGPTWSGAASSWSRSSSPCRDPRPGPPRQGRPGRRRGRTLRRSPRPVGMRTRDPRSARGHGVLPGSSTFEVDDLPTVRGLVSAGLGSWLPAMGPAIPTTFARTRLLPLTDAGAQREVGVVGRRAACCPRPSRSGGSC